MNSKSCVDTFKEEVSRPRDQDVKADLFALLTEEHDESLRALGRAILRAVRRDQMPIERKFVRASDLLVARASTQRIRMKPSDRMPVAMF